MKNASSQITRPAKLIAVAVVAFWVCGFVGTIHAAEPTFDGGQPYYVAPSGSDGNPGTLEKPFATIQHAQQAVRRFNGSAVQRFNGSTVWLRGGTYYLAEKLVFNAGDSGSQAAPVVYQAYGKEQPVISGGVRLEKLDWQPYRDGIVQAKVPEDLQTEEIITNNLCLHGGIKNREGYGRMVENNITIGSGLHPHVWFAASGDVFRRNIVWRDYQPAIMPAPPWGQELDYNLMHREGATNGILPLPKGEGRGEGEGSGRIDTSVAIAPATRLRAQSGRDEHSIVADAQFIDPVQGDYRVKEGSPALTLGFVNFPMDRFGVQRPPLKALSRTPVLPGHEPVNIKR